MSIQFSFSAKTIVGEGKGKELGFPTINLIPPDELNIADGVYIASVKISNVLYPAGLHYGIKKTLSPNLRSLEVHLLNYHQGTLPDRVDVDVKKYIRPVKEFNSAEALSRQIAADIQAVKEFFDS